MMLENPGAIKHALFLFAMFAVQLVAIAAKIDGNRRGCRECTVCLAAVLTACAWFCPTFTGWPLPWSVSLVPVALGLLSLACMPCFGWVFGQGGARVAFFFVYVVRALRGRMMGGCALVTWHCSRSHSIVPVCGGPCHRDDRDDRAALGWPWVNAAAGASPGDCPGLVRAYACSAAAAVGC